MKTLKLALLATSAVGAVAAGGIAYATVGNSSPVTSAKLPSAASAVRHGPAVPHSAPTCLPKATKAKHLPKLPDAARRASVPGQNQLPKVPGTNGLAQRADGLAQGAEGRLPQAPDSGRLPQAPATRDLPTCAPRLPSHTPAKPPVPQAKPNVPNLPNVRNLASCSAVPPAIRMEHGRARNFRLPNGMHLAYSHSHSVMIDGRRVCGNIERFAGTAGRWFTVERLNTRPRTTVRDVAKALKLPAAGDIASVNGTNTWRSPLNTGSMWISGKGYALSVSGSPTMAGELPGIVSQLRRTA